MDTENHTLTIRPLTFLDIEEVTVLHSLCFDHPWRFESFQALMLNPQIRGWIYRHENDVLVGIIMGQFIPPEAEIYTLAIHPVYRRQKIATQLLKAFLKYCQENHLQKVMLEVSVDNLGAIGLYKHLNFKTTGRREKYYYDEKGFYIDACLLEININI